MAAEYDFRRKPDEKGNGELQPFYPRIVSKGTIDSKQLFREIAEASSFTEGDLEGIMVSLQNKVSYYLSEGFHVKLGEIGYFSSSLTARPVMEKKEIRSVSIWFDIRDGLVSGEIVYTRTKAKIPIRLLGREEDDGSYRLHEMLPNGDISGTITGTLVNGVLSGTWHGRPRIVEKNEGDYEYKDGKKFTIKVSVVERTHAPYNWSFDVEKASGTYAYSLGDNCDDGTVVLQVSNDGTVRYRLIGLTGAPSYRMACFPEDALSGEIAVANLHGNRILIEEDETCAIEILLYNDFLVSRYVDGKDCRYRVGNGATAEGLFLKKR